MSQRKKLLSSSSIRVHGQAIINLASTGSIGSTPLIPTMIARLSTIGDAFAEYRFNKISLRPLGSGATGYNATSITNVYSTTAAPTTLQHVVESGKSIAFAASAPNVLPTLMVAKEINSGVLKWWKNPVTSASDDFEYQGMIYQYTATATDSMYYFVVYDCEFRMPLATAVSYAPRPFPRIREPLDDTSSVKSDRSFVSVEPHRVRR